MAKNKTFEEKMKELEEKVTLLESGEVGLEESIGIITQAAAIIKELEKELDDTEGKLKLLDLKTDEITPFSEDEA